MDSPDAGAHTIRVTPPADEDVRDNLAGSPRESEGSPTSRLIKRNLRTGREKDGPAVDGKSIKSVSDHNLQVGVRHPRLTKTTTQTNEV